MLKHYVLEDREGNVILEFFGSYEISFDENVICIADVDDEITRLQLI